MSVQEVKYIKWIHLYIFFSWSWALQSYAKSIKQVMRETQRGEFTKQLWHCSELYLHSLTTQIQFNGKSYQGKYGKSANVPVQISFSMTF